MTTPKVVTFDQTVQTPISPIQVRGLETSPPADEDRIEEKSDFLKRRTRRHELEFRNLRTKYEEAKIRMGKVKKESEANKKMLLEMSRVVKALQDISIDYDKLDGESRTTSLENVQRKIRAMDEQLQSAVIHNGHLQEEKSLQQSTIMAQEGQIRSLESQVKILQSRLNQMSEEKRRDDSSVQESLSSSVKDLELQSTISAQEETIRRLQQQVGHYERDRNSVVAQEINEVHQLNRVKYAEINNLEAKLQALRAQQNGHKAPNLIPMNKPKEETKSEEPRQKERSVISQAFARLKGVMKPLEPINEDDESCTPSAATASDKSGSEFADESSVTSKNGSTIKITASEDSGVEMEISPHGSGLDINMVSVSTDCDATFGSEYSSARETHSSSTSSEADETTKQSEANLSIPQLESKSTYETDESEYLMLLEEAYNMAVEKLQKLEKENKKLRASQGQALASMAETSETSAKGKKLQQENISLRKQIQEGSSKYENMRQQHAKILEELKELQANIQRNSGDSQTIEELQKAKENHGRLQKIHEVVVMKVADLGEENETLQNELEEAKKKLSHVSSAPVELEATKAEYAALQKEHAIVAAKIEHLCNQYDMLKEKYIEAVTETNEPKGAVDQATYDSLCQEHEANLIKLKELEYSIESEERLKQEYADTLARVMVLEESNRELEGMRQKYNSGEAKIIQLERDLAKAAKKAKVFDTKQQEKANYLRDIIVQYKALKQEHAHVTDQYKRLQAVVSGNGEAEIQPTDDTASNPEKTKAAAVQAKAVAYNRRIKELQHQRDTALEQMKQVQEELVQLRQETDSAVESRKKRESDLKVVLHHYEKLQNRYEEVVAKAKELKQENVEMSAAQKESNNDAEDVSSTQVSTDTETETRDCSNEVEESDSINSPEVGERRVINRTEAKEGDTVSDQIETSETTTSLPDDDSVAQLMTEMKDLQQKKREDTDGESSAPPERSHGEASNLETPEMESSSISEGYEEEIDENTPGWKDKKIVQVLAELQEANDKVEELQGQYKGAMEQLDSTERQLLVAQREAEDAKKKKESREVNLRDVISKHLKLERGMIDTQEKVKLLQGQLEHAKREARIREEEAKAARKRLAGCHFQYKRLQEDHEVALEQLKTQKQELDEIQWDVSFLEDASNMREFRSQVMGDKAQLAKETETMKSRYHELLRKYGKANLSPEYYVHSKSEVPASLTAPTASSAGKSKKNKAFKKKKV